MVSWTPLSFCWYSWRIQAPDDPKYVFEYGVDRQKIQAMILQEFPNEDVSQAAITRVVDLILEYVDTSTNPLTGGEPGGSMFVVVAFGDDAFEDSYEELEKKRLSLPEYLKNYKSLFYGPAVFNCLYYN